MIEKENFRSYTLDEEKEEGDVISIRLNPEEKAWLEEIKEDFDVKSDGKALKFAAFVGKNVIQQAFGRRLLRFLFKKERQRLTDYKNY